MDANNTPKKKALKTCKDKVAALLSDGMWHNSEEFRRVGGGERYSGRIGELRRDDQLVIIQRTNPQGGQDYQSLGPRCAENEKWAKEYDKEPRLKPLYLDEKQAKHMMIALAHLYETDPEGFERSTLGPIYGKLRKIAPAGYNARKIARQTTKGSN